jgi:predicted nucleic acid-binding protein
MHDKIVMDSCIIAAIFLPEAITDKAIEAAVDHECTTVDLAYTEVANAAWKRTVHNGQDMQTVKTCLDDAMAFIKETCDVIPADELIIPAWDLACRHRITIYDALFVASSVRCDAPLVTADKRLAAVAGISCTIVLIE